MIALTDGLPCIQFEGGNILAFQRDWLLRELREAAFRAGYAEWWLAEHIAETVTSWLRARCEENVIDVARLTRAVRSVLQVTGYAEVGTQFAPGVPPRQISLMEIAQHAGFGYELAFFDILNQRLQEGLATQAQELRFHGLERCVKHLCMKKIWCRECDTLRTEIVLFIRNQLDSGANGRAFSVSVL